MGQYTSRSSGRWFKKMEVKLIMHGLDAAGKTTILYKLKLGEVVETNPTIGFVQETMSYNNIHIIAWDVGGRSAIRPLYRYYYPGTDAVLFIVDSNDKERIEEVKDELVRLVDEKEFVDAIFLVLANKQDLPHAMTVAEVAEAVNFERIQQTHRANIMGCCACVGDGLNEAMDWLSRELETSRRSPDADPSAKERGDTVEKTEKTPWSLNTYVKGNLESLKALLPKLG
ncbi:ADP-ribosylation factor 1-like [Haliotis asinina]|uniref:ADP-ribosylation factor 1-like n=1 Tax=Haliotis asinina TaxID=109174 RepID=UPI003531D7C4